MILVDTSVWVTHLQQGNSRLATLLEEMKVLTHPFVIGELALGQLAQRVEILELLGNLPTAKLATHDEVLSMIDKRDLASSGIGWVDAHLLASALLSDAPLWSLDRRLAAAATRLELAP
ncbi:MAG: PIN domain-containing protein [Nitrospirae bacterium]|nr:PIN domain-containing protein [Nitrospirota bacterium]